VLGCIFYEIIACRKTFPGGDWEILNQPWNL